MKKIIFDSDWYFRRAGLGHAFAVPEGEKIHLPHDAQILEPRSAEYETGGGGAYFKNGLYKYEKTFFAPEEWQGNQVALEFEGVYQWTEVVLNGDLIATWPYGYSGFLVDLTEKLQYGAENKLQVTANNTAVPNSRWYSGAGIYRHVWLQVGGAVSILPWGVQVTTPEVSAESTEISVAAKIKNIRQTPVQVTVRQEVLDSTANVVAQVQTEVELLEQETQAVCTSIPLASPALWCVDAPNLYTLKTTLLEENVSCDSSTTVFGIRKIEVDAQNGFRLNGVPMKIKGGCVHHDNGLLGSASFDKAEERKVLLMKQSGFNMIRCAHNPPAPAMLEACDRLGMMVMDETFDCWTMGKNPNDYHVHFQQWWDKDTRNMVERDFNHPSVVMWSIGNEILERDGSSDGHHWSRRQAELVRTLDTSRPVTSALCDLWDELPGDTTVKGLYDRMVGRKMDPENDRWGKKTAGYAAPLDVVGYNYQMYRYGHDGEAFPDRVIAGTETFPSVQYRYWTETMKHPHVIGDFVWTSIDYLGEAGIGRAGYDTGDHELEMDYPWHQAFCGDIDICGFKRPQSYFRDIMWGVRKAPYIAVHHPEDHGKQVIMSPWGWSPAVPCWDYPGYENKPVTVEVYACQSEVELLINGQSCGRKPAGASQENIAYFEVNYQPGTLTAVAYENGEEAQRFELCTAGSPAKLRITPDRQVLEAKYGDLVYLTTEVLDAQDRVVRYAQHSVTFTVEGSGSLQAVGNSDPKSPENYFGNTRKAFRGSLMAVVKTIGETGTIRIKAKSPGLQDAKVEIQVQ